MPLHPVLYYITDRSQFPGTEPVRRQQLLARIAEAARNRVDLIQLREKDLSARELETLARHALASIRENSPASEDSPTRLLINSRIDVALAVDAAGVHLRSDDASVRDARHIVGSIGRSKPFLIAVSCHTVEEVRRAAEDRADFVVLAPIFEKQSATEVVPLGLKALGQVCQIGISVLALGGVTLNNAAACIHAGAAGVAGIRLFQQGSIQTVVKELRVVV